METRKDNLLENLDETKRTWLLELASHARLVDVVEALKEEGIETSVSSLSRFVRRHREDRLIEEGQDMKETVEVLAKRGQEGKLREGTLEAVRQRLFDQVADSQSPEEARQLYGALVKEEATLKELELESRRVAIAEEELKLERLRVELQAAQFKAAARGRVKGVVTAPAAVTKDGTVGTDEIDGRTAPPAQLSGPSENERRLMELVNDLAGILNRGGPVEEKFLEARFRVCEGMKGLISTS